MNIFKKKNYIDPTDSCQQQDEKETQTNIIKERHELVVNRLNMLRERIKSYEDIVASDEQHIAKDSAYRRLLIMESIIRDKLDISDEEYNKYAAKIDAEYPEFTKRMNSYQNNINYLRSSIRNLISECRELRKSCHEKIFGISSSDELIDDENKI